ncbi:sugar nucleotide-binding protein [Candidatus Daviesbacteria bacterium]|nr:sugar nucleotide-binding protein [Candidatus Daviesbacteria bacterium]
MKELAGSEEKINQTLIQITGATGLVGSRLVELLANKWNFVALDRQEAENSARQLPIIKYQMLDLLSSPVEQIIADSASPYFLHLAAFTDVDAAEKQRGQKQDSLAWKLNVDATDRIARACRQSGKLLIYISTDFIFDGKKGPYKEDDQLVDSPDEISWYGWTKLAGEQKIQQSGVEAAVVRIAYPFRANYPQKLDFASRIIDLYKKDQLYPMFDDQELTPTWVDDLSLALDKILSDRLTGIFHVAAANGDKITISPYDFAVMLLDRFFQAGHKVKRGSLAESLRSGKTTPRPVQGGLLTGKIENCGVKLSSVEQAIDQLYDQQQAN